MVQSIADKFSNGKVPSCLKFSVKENSDGILTAVVRGEGHKAVDGGCRIVDPWAVAFIDELNNNCLPNAAIRCLHIELENNPKDFDLESFRRRLSYLALNNGWSVDLFVSGESKSLYTDWVSLLNRPPNEEINLEDIATRTDSDDTDGKLEKNFQTWLAGKKRSSNERLCLLGEDFIFDKKSEQKVLREFATGAYREKKKKENRILPTYWLDFVTVNRRKELALIELKVNDINLEVLAQLLDYALFFTSYATPLSDVLSKLEISVDPEKKIACYVVNTKFHPRFDTIAPYFAPRSEEAPFTLSKVLLGSMTNVSVKKGNG